MIALNVFCADTQDRAEAMTRAADLTYIRFIRRRGLVQVCSPEDAARHVWTTEELAFVQGVAAGRAVGTGPVVRDRLEAFVRRFGADEVMSVCNTFHFSDRLRSFELLARAWTGRDAVPAAARATVV